MDGSQQGSGENCESRETNDQKAEAEEGEEESESSSSSLFGSVRDDDDDDDEDDSLQRMEGKEEENGASSTSSTTESDDELEVMGIVSLEQQLEQFRIQWRKEMRGSEDEGSPNGRDEAVHQEKEKEQEALFLYRQGVREEKRGNMYSAVMMYRRAMQLIPDIESRVPELRDMKRSYRRRRRASSGGSTSEPDGAKDAADAKDADKDAKDGEKAETGEKRQEKKPHNGGQETIVEEETTTAFGAAASGENENCFTIPDSDDFGQKDDLCLSVTSRKSLHADVSCENLELEDVIPPGVTLIEHITAKRLKSPDPTDKLACRPDATPPDGSIHFSHLPPEIVVYILRWVVSDECDVRSLERVSAVCRGFYLFARDKDLWKLLCQKMWTLECTSPKTLGYSSYRQMYLRRPHPVFDGIYIAKTSYIRQGDQSLGNSYRHWQLVEYFRYIRLFSDGFMFMLTTCDDPMTTIPKIKSRTTKYPGLLTGYYRSIDCDDGKERLSAILSRTQTTIIAPSRRQRRGANAQHADADDRSFHMELEMLLSGKKRLHPHLKWRSFSVHSVSRASGETNVSEFDLTNNGYPDLYFSRVKSYALSSSKPLQL